MAVTYCFNTSNGAMTQWPGFGFMRIVRVDHDYYGIASDGVYLLGGNLDELEPITATIQTAPTDFQSTALKRVPYARLNANADCRVSLIFDEGQSVSDSEFKQDRRVKFGKGIRGRYAAFRVESDQEDFELLSMDVYPVALMRGVK